LDLFLDNERIEELPAFLAEKISQMMSEIRQSGEETTAYETIAVIEATFTHLGRLWVAEYLHAIEQDRDFLDEELTRTIFEMSRSNVTLGRWVGVSRCIRDYFVAQGRKTVVRDLAKADFGVLGNKQHPVASLIAFRNSFSHGAMNLCIKEIRQHRYLIQSFLETLPALVEQPIVFATENPGEIRHANQYYSVAEALCLELSTWNPVILAIDGGLPLSLYPLYYTTESSGLYQLKSTHANGQTYSIDKLFECDLLQTWMARYLRERAGHIDFTEVLVFRSQRKLDSEFVSALDTAVADADNHLILVESHPGCGKCAVLSCLPSLNASSVFGVHASFLVNRGDLGQSGVTFVQFVLRQIEKAIGLPDDSYKIASRPLEVLNHALSDLKAADVRVLIGLEDLQNGQATYRDEELTLLDVYLTMFDSPVTVVATTYPGSVEGPLFFDECLRLSIPRADFIDKERLSLEVEYLCGASPLHRNILRLLGAVNEPQGLFAICDELERQGLPTLFEPEVERALWELRPVLILSQKDDQKVYGLFSPVVNEISYIEVQS